MDPANVREALKEVALDLEEGADMIMVKPVCRISTLSPASASNFRAGRCLQRQRRIRHGRRRAKGWLDENVTPRNPHRHPTRRRRYHFDVSCQAAAGWLRA
jgi:hypothetical protein